MNNGMDGSMKGGGANRRVRNKIQRCVRALAAMLLAAAYAIGAAACAPHDAAVGDTQKTAAAIAHDYVQGDRITVGIVGSSQESAPTLAMLKALDSHNMVGLYMGGSDSDDSRTGAVADLVHRRAHLVLIDGFTKQQAASAAWTAALQNARDAGVAVAFVNAEALPANPVLYAASITVPGHNMDSVSFASAVDAIVRDEPHAKHITVASHT